VDKFAQQFPTPSIEWAILMPVILVVATGIVALILKILQPKRNNNLIVGVSLAGLLAAGYFTVAQFGQPAAETFAGMMRRDSFGLAMQLLLIGACFVSILLSEGYLREKRIAFGEFYPLVLWSTAGAMIMATTTSLLMVFVGLEVLSIALYVLAGLSRQESRSEESALKYFLLGAFASGFLLFGIAFFYGATGSLDLRALPDAAAMGSEAERGLLLFGLGLMLVGFGFKAAFVPFHQWTPDVYQGAPTNVTAFMAAGSKIAAIAALVRLLDAAAPLQELWMPALFWIAILTMTVGNLVALVQRDVKRILAYSSIAHAGYILVGVLAHAKNPGEIGYGTTIYYLLAYGLMTVGAFAIVTLTAKGGQEGTRLADFHGLWKRSPLSAMAVVVFMASLIGIPPTAGFFGKLLIFNDALVAGLVPLAIVLAVNSAISIYYYLGIALAVFVSDEEGVETAPVSAGVATAALVCAAGVLAAAIFFSPLMRALAPKETPETVSPLPESDARQRL
jgi:NADH-quinone oxidoreductase subunit N